MRPVVCAAYSSRSNSIYYFFFAQLLLNDSKSNSNAKGFGSYTPLHIAAQIDSVDICKQLVSKRHTFLSLQMDTF